MPESGQPQVIIIVTEPGALRSAGSTLWRIFLAARLALAEHITDFEMRAVEKIASAHAARVLGLKL